MSVAAGAREIEFRALHALRVKGVATAAEVARLTGIDGVAEALAALVAQKLVARRAGGEGEYHALTSAGHDAHGAAVAERLGLKARGLLAAAYDSRFLAVNLRFKQLCADWQEQGERFELVEAAADVHDDIIAVLRTAAAADVRFERYAERLNATMDAFQGGDARALTAPVGESYHNVWFELHEDLLVTLSRSRRDEAD